VPSDDIGGFASRVLASTEVQWKAIFQQAGQAYRPPVLVLYQRQTHSGCGKAQSAMGPFYCPTDQKIYLDTSFLREIETRFHGCDVGSRACQFSQAYVLAREVGHHVQNLLGILPKVQQNQQGMDYAAANQLQVRVELQADCLAGIWANHENQRQLREGRPAFIEAGDVDAALKTATAIRQDTLQRQTTEDPWLPRYSSGSAEQRQRWFSTGLKEGTLAACNTFRERSSE
jgi:predicted metalloprotease